MSAALMAIAAKKQQKSSGGGGAPKQQYGGRKGELPAMAKTVLVIAGVAVVGLVIYKISKVQKGKGKGNRVEDKELNKEFYDLQKKNSTKATITKGGLAQMANNVFTAMDGYGTDEDTIIRELKKIKTDGDFVGLQNAYGIREVSSGRLNPSPNFKGTLTAALTDELSDYWIKEINSGLKRRDIRRSV
jgi:hypothetical protein